MKRILFVPIILVMLCSNLIAQTGLEAFLPKNDELPGWVINGKVSEYSNEELIFAVNKESDLLQEFGFMGVLETSFINEYNEEVTLEIFRMKDIYGSYGVYLHKTEGMEEKYDVGKDAFIDASSLVMWKNHYIAVIKIKKQSDNAISGMKMLADIIDSRIKIPGRWPKITHTFRDAPGKVTLLRGKVSLQNVYYFTSKDVFRIEEGYAIEKPGLTDIYLWYSESYTSIQRFGEVAGVLSRDKRFSGFTMIGDTSFRMYDDNGNDISIESDNNYLNIRIQKSIITSEIDSN